MYGITVLPAITLPTRAEYVFGGYFTQTGGRGAKIIDASGKWVYTNTSLTANATAYAYWVSKPPVTGKITYLLGNSTAGTAPNGQTKYKGINLTISANSGNLVNTNTDKVATTTYRVTLNHDNGSPTTGQIDYLD